MNLKSICAVKGLSFKELSKATGLSLNYIYEIERGSKTPSVDTLKKLKKVLDVPIDFLIKE